MNLKFTVAYDGSLYLGSQKQPNKNTIEDELLKAFKTLNIETSIVLSGRTDKEVHATGQVFNCIIPDFWTDFFKLQEILNKRLPSSIQIRHIVKVDENFHSRFHAKKRVYRYLITTKPTTPFNDKFITYVKSVDEKLLKEAIKEFIGVYDFKYFHKTGSDKDITIREIFETAFYKHKDIYVFKFVANSYLRSQIRLMVGFLLAINDKKLTIEDLKKQLRCEKNIFKIPIKANGLYLAKIKY
ncbi:tRNA pseudouridine(38-40) synthase TruA [Arcobacter ellisii]|jgi:tRNA pseudouridine38-40 synthase|uniref:tRNA pseudouridine synthase A n=1 Tax=Arcobacter ellisii TaxID=913109 RepID=A0A347UBN8_9BACT|nr:tRNA pseudouridine(38-40) synthase TruA [Arcobacter ellisii]AXX96266.1 tRNA pseudouridine(38-40) synthase [Arcobacter ellisii]RXI31889.1 tRNA pseudouridine(38-40) synthase TruA [Arcobacter ellisii]